MQPLKISIEGEYFDSHIYRDKLYLFDLNGVLRTYAWPRVLDLWKVPESLNLAVECAFFRGDFLYERELQRMFVDADVKALVRKKFDELSQLDLYITREHLIASQVAEQDSPFPFPHAGIEIYSRTAYSASSEGVHAASTESTSKKIIRKQAERLWDAPCSGISASWGSLALSCGSSGLWELRVGSYQDPEDENARMISDQHSTSSDWNYHSIFSSSSITGGYLAKYNREKSDRFPGSDQRVFERIVSAEEIFGTAETYSWGNRDKICGSDGAHVTVIKFNPFDTEGEGLFRQLDKIPMPPGMGSIVSAGTAAFGIVLELENGIAVVESDGSIETIQNEPVNWKTFPRSTMYSNQLHVVREDSLDLLSFNQDYFLSQDDKIVGSIPYTGIGRRIAAA